MENRRAIQSRYSSLILALSTLALLLSPSSWAQLAAGQEKFLGNVINSSVPSSFSQFWNQVTPENAGKWGSVESTRNQMNWQQLDVIYNFAQQNGYKFKGHTLVWGSQFPEWLSGLSPAQQRAEIEEWIQAYAARYPGTWAIDVVNEPIKTPLPWKAALGGDGATGWDWVITAFQLARQYLPDTLLLINEYGTENDPPARARYLAIINLLKTRGLLDGIGVQAHYFNLDNMTASQMTAALNDYAATGLDVYVSELDITGGNGESTQAAKYQELFPVIWNHPSVRGVTLWGYIAGQTWREGTGIVNSNQTDRQAMSWLKGFLSPTQNTLAAAPETLSFGTGAANGFVAITSNSAWNATDNATWLTVAPSAGTNNGSFTVSTTANMGAARSGTVTVTAGNLTRAIAVTQAGTIMGGGPVTVTSAVTSASGWFNEQQVRISHTTPLTALSVTVVIQRTTGMNVSGQYNTVGSQLTQSSSGTGSTLTYQFTLAAGQTLGASHNRIFAAQMSGNGMVHPTTGDTYTVTYTSGGQSFTQTGAF
jgi:endo-1,4-beta-xylanase